MQSGKAAKVPVMEILPPLGRSDKGAELIARDCPQCGTRVRKAQSFGSRFVCESCKAGDKIAEIDPAKAIRLSRLDINDQAGSDPLLVLRKGFVPRQDEARHSKPASGIFARMRPYLAILFLAASCGWLASELVMNQVPGIDRMTTGSVRGLDISSLEARQLQRNGEYAVQVRGRITNRSSARLPVETIAISLLDSDGNKASDWIFHPAIRYLDPGSSFSFSTAKGNAGLTHASVAVTVGGVTRQTGL
ncbi:MAG: hypothetical protein KDJ66_15930 [Nitratireductor sp.]|nr:hypothetical protein [Nitratireductor sp.]